MSLGAFRSQFQDAQDLQDEAQGESLLGPDAKMTSSSRWGGRGAVHGRRWRRRAARKRCALALLRADSRCPFAHRAR